jgi:hypothetical protein
MAKTTKADKASEAAGHEAGAGTGSASGWAPPGPEAIKAALEGTVRAKPASREQAAKILSLDGIGVALSTELADGRMELCGRMAKALLAQNPELGGARLWTTGSGGLQGKAFKNQAERALGGAAVIETLRDVRQERGAALRELLSEALSAPALFFILVGTDQMDVEDWREWRSELAASKHPAKAFLLFDGWTKRDDELLAMVRREEAECRARMERDELAAAADEVRGQDGGPGQAARSASGSPRAEADGEAAGAVSARPGAMGADGAEKRTGRRL